MFQNWEFSVDFYEGALIGGRVYLLDDAKVMVMYIPFICFCITRYSK